MPREQQSTPNPDLSEGPDFRSPPRSHAGPITRLAPSPTGALHLGNARTFLINWAMAKQQGWRIVLRIEDLDTPRTKAGADALAIEDLRWLGMDWDEGPHYQLADLSPYEAALNSLRAMGAAYPCTCSRKEIEQAQSAPHAGDHEMRYPGTCRARLHDDAAVCPEGAAWRVVAPSSPIAFHDRFTGEHRIDVNAEVGDFVIATKANLPAYQLAVVVDDARQGVTDIVRGDDLITSTARQLWLYRLLRLGPPPRYWHLPLVIGPDGRRLAKRHGDTRVSHYRELGVCPHRLIALLARWSGINNAGDSMTAPEFADRFAIDRLPPRAITCTPEDHAWLTAR